jgi:hypothetical protein
MPIINYSEVGQDLNAGFRMEEEKPEAQPQAREVIKAAFQRENTVGSLLQYSERTPFDDTFNPFDDLEGYEDKANSFVFANTPEQVAGIKTKIDRERDNEKLLQDSGALGFAAVMAAGVFDPVNLIPVGGAAYKSYTMGGSILKGASNTARAGLLSSTVAEAALHATQETRTYGESGVNIAGATLLSGVLGGAVGYIGGRGLKDLGVKIEDELVIPRPDEPDINEPRSIILGGDSAGAMAVRNTTMAEETLSNAWGLEKGLARLNPKLRLATSASIESRRYAQDLIETPFYYEKNDAGIANPVAIETIVAMQDARAAKVIDVQNNTFTKYKKRMKAEGGGSLPYQEFREEISKALRRNDTHAIPEVQEMARAYRKEVFDPLKDAAIKVGLLPEDVKTKTADSYLYRWWDKQKVAAKRNELHPVILDSLKLEVQKMRAAGVKANPDKVDLLDMSVDELSQIVDDIIDNILGGADTRIPYDLPVAARGPLKKRVLNFVRDDAVEGFLVNDAEAVARQFIRTMAPDIAIKERFGELNIIGKDGIITQKINDDYNTLIDNAKTEKERMGLQKLKNSDIRDVDAIVNQIRGTYGIPENPDSVITRTGRAIRNLNYISKLGGVTASSIPDVGRAVMVHGMIRSFKDGIVPLVTNFKALKLSAREVKEAGTALDMTLNTRALTLAELNDPYLRGNKFERGLQGLSNTFGKFTLMAPWNTALKQFSGVVTQGRVIDSVAKSVQGNIKPKDARYLNMIGIDANMAKRIAKQLDNHGDDIDGVKIANTKDWTDSGATLAYRAAIKKEVDRIIVTPGAGDLPLILKGTEAGKMIGQFRSFSFAATNKILISGLQERDAAFMNGVILSVGLGMLSYGVKAIDAGREVSDDPAVWIQEGFDRSGILGILSEVNQISNKVSRGTISLNALAGQPPLTRYASVNTLGTVLGPSVGTAQDITQIAGSGLTGEWTESDSRALRRMIPYQNLMIVRQLFDEIEEGANESLGVE